MRRVGMFISMQFYMMTMYDEIWDGPIEQLQFFSVQQNMGIKQSVHLSLQNIFETYKKIAN